MTLEQMILNELQQMELGGIRILSVISKPDVTQVIFEAPPTIVEFKVNNECQYQILKVTYQGVVYEHPEYLSQFNQVVIHVINIIKPIEKAKRDELAKQLAVSRVPQSRLEAVEQREQKINELERMLEEKELVIKAREELIKHKEQVLASKRAVALKEKNARKVANRENTKEMIKKHTNITHYFKKKANETKGETASEEDELDTSFEQYDDDLD